MRVSKRDLEEMVAQLNVREGRPRRPYLVHAYIVDGETQTEPVRDPIHGTRVPAPGHVLLDHAAHYGGYSLREMTEGGGEGFYWPSWDRVSAREMYHFLLGKLHEPHRRDHLHPIPEAQAEELDAICGHLADLLVGADLPAREAMRNDLWAAVERHAPPPARE